MYNNKKELKELGEQTGLFELIRMNSLSDLQDFPALLILDAEDKDRKAMNTMHTRYQTSWTYSINVISRYDNEKSDEENELALELLTESYKAKLIGTSSAPGDFLVLSEYRGEALVSGCECLVTEIVVKVDGRELYG